MTTKMTRKKYTIEFIDGLKKELATLPPVERKNKELSGPGAIGLLTDEINALQNRGYTLEQIAEVLREHRLDIATPVLKNYLTRTKEMQKKLPVTKTTKSIVLTKKAIRTEQHQDSDNT